MADDGVVEIHIPVLPQHIDKLEVQNAVDGTVVTYDIGPLQSTDWTLAVDAPVGTPVHSRYRTLTGGVVSPMSDWSNTVDVKSVPEPGLVFGLIVCTLLLVMMKEWWHVNG